MRKISKRIAAFVGVTTVVVGGASFAAFQLQDTVIGATGSTGSTQAVTGTGSVVDVLWPGDCSAVTAHLVNPNPKAVSDTLTVDGLKLDGQLVSQTGGFNYQPLLKWKPGVDVQHVTIPANDNLDVTLTSKVCLSPAATGQAKDIVANVVLTNQTAAVGNDY